MWVALRRLLQLLLWSAGPIPQHVAFIMDGNRRYADQAGVQRLQGHVEGYKKMVAVLRWCLELGITTVSVYAFSIDNFARSADEVAGLMELAEAKYHELCQDKTVASWRVAVRVVGDLELAPPRVQAAAARLMLTSAQRAAPEPTAVINICFAYTSTQELEASVLDIRQGVAASNLLAQDATPALLLRCMHMGGSPPVDLLVRTSGAQRLSDFLLWQAAAAQLQFLPVLWPSFGFGDLAAAIVRWQRAAPSLRQLQAMAAAAAAAGATAGQEMAALATTGVLTEPAASASANGVAAGDAAAAAGGGVDAAAGAWLRAGLQRSASALSSIAARGELAVGELLCIDNFSLFEAMSAVEVGNTKMDAGAMTDEPPLPLSERPLPLDLTPEQLLAVMDHLLALEAAWHMGNPLAQTVYSSLYMMQLPRLAGHKVLNAYCQAMQATCIQVHHVVMQGCVCEEEDFNINTQGLPLDGVQPGPETTDKAPSALSMAIDAVQEMGLSSPLAAALRARLGLRRCVLQGLARLRHKQGDDLDAAGRAFAKAQIELAAVQESLGLAAVEPVPLGFDPTVNAHLTPAGPPRLVQLLSVDSAVKQWGWLLRELSQAVTVARVADWPALKQFLEAFADDLPSSVARSALHMQLAPSSWGLAQPPAGGAQPPPPTEAPPPGPPPPWVPTRAMLMADLWLGGGVDATPEVAMFLEQAHIATTNWVQVMMLNRARQRRRLRRMLDDWGNLYQHALVADAVPAFREWTQASGWNWRPADPEDAQGPLATWVEREACSSMLGHLLLGCELDLYEPSELVMVYWYSDYIVRCAQAAARTLLESRPQQRPPLSSPAPAPAPSGAAASKGPSLKRGGGAAGGAAAKAAARNARQATAAAAAAAATAAAQEQAVARLELLQLELQHYAFLGMFNLGLGLGAAGLVLTPDPPFNTPRERYDQRFACLHQLVRPDPLGWEQFEESSRLGDVPPARLFQLAGDCWGKVRRGVAVLRATLAGMGASEARLERVAALDKVAAQNHVAVTLLARVQRPTATEAPQPAQSGSANGSSGGSGATPQLAPRFEFKHLKWLPALELKTAKGSSGGGAKAADGAQPAGDVGHGAVAAEGASAPAAPASMLAAVG